MTNEEDVVPKPRVKVKLDRSAVRRLERQAVQQVQEPANEVMRDAVRRVRDRGGDRTVDQVYRELVGEIHGALGAMRFKPNEARLREFAQAIVAGELED